jgi:hypothetical protein
VIIQKYKDKINIYTALFDDKEKKRKKKALQLSQEEALTPSLSKNNDNVIPFVSTYNASLPNIGNIIHKYWDLLKLSKSISVQYVYEHFKPILAYKRAKNIQDTLTGANFSSNLNVTYSSTNCSRVAGVLTAKILKLALYLVVIL